MTHSPNSDNFDDTLSEATTLAKSTAKLIDRKVCIEIAKSTLKRIEDGSYTVGDIQYNIRDAVFTTNNSTRYFASDSELSHWAAIEGERAQVERPAVISVMECSTLEGARRLKLSLGDSLNNRIGVLNFASAKSPGGGFLGGSRAQEESLARSSTLYPSLKTSTAEPFYTLHKAHSKHGLYSHAMIYSPGVLFMRADAGDWLPPLAVDVVTAPAVNAGSYRNHLRKQNIDNDTEIDATMKERMARILYLFELQGVQNVILGSFGTGAFKNTVELVASVWKELLVGGGARFRTSFDRVVFAVIDSETYQKFESMFGTQSEYCHHAPGMHSLTVPIMPVESSGDMDDCRC